MNGIKRMLKLFGLACLIVLATVGIGIGGGAPILSTNKREERAEMKIELLESDSLEEDITINNSIEFKH